MTAFCSAQNKVHQVELIARSVAKPESDTQAQHAAPKQFENHTIQRPLQKRDSKREIAALDLTMKAQTRNYFPLEHPKQVLSLQIRNLSEGQQLMSMR